MSFRSSKLSELSTPIISSQLVSKPASQQVSQLASEPTTLPASQPVSQLASRPASQSSESVSPVSQSVSQPTDQPIITLVHGCHLSVRIPEPKLCQKPVVPRIFGRPNLKRCRQFSFQTYRPPHCLRYRKVWPRILPKLYGYHTQVIRGLKGVYLCL